MNIKKLLKQLLDGKITIDEATRDIVHHISIETSGAYNAGFSEGEQSGYDQAKEGR